jgi:hypothetical protein
MSKLLILLCVPVFLVFVAVQFASADLPQQDIENAIGAQGQLNGGVLDIPILRTDIGNVSSAIGSITFTPDFQLHGDLYFQSTKEGKAYVNGYMPLLVSEVDRFISVALNNGIDIQSFEQHVPMHPMVWYVHFGGQGDAVALATALKLALAETTAPFPQTLPSNPNTSLDVQKLADTLHGTVSIGGHGVVTVTVARKKNVAAGKKLKLKPGMGTSTTIEINPTSSTTADVAVTFAMISTEVTKVLDLMRNTSKWRSGGLVTHELKEKPQLYYGHMIKTGDPYQLATEIRQALDLTASD